MYVLEHHIPSHLNAVHHTYLTYLPPSKFVSVRIIVQAFSGSTRLKKLAHIVDEESYNTYNIIIQSVYLLVCNAHKYHATDNRLWVHTCTCEYMHIQRAYTAKYRYVRGSSSQGRDIFLHVYFGATWTTGHNLYVWNVRALKTTTGSVIDCESDKRAQTIGSTRIRENAIRERLRFNLFVFALFGFCFCYL